MHPLPDAVLASAALPSLCLCSATLLLCKKRPSSAMRILSTCTPPCNANSPLGH